jgi:hypothetical protein
MELVGVLLTVAILGSPLVTPQQLLAKGVQGVWMGVGGVLQLLLQLKERFTLS